MMSKVDLRIFGNTLGWAISAALVVAALGLVSAIDAVGQPTPPTEFSRRSEFSEMLSLPIAPEIFLRSADDQDAAVVYRQALAIYRQHPDVYLIFAKTGRATDLGQIEPALGPLRDGAGLRTPQLFADAPAAIVAYHPDIALEQYSTLGRCAVNAAVLAAERGDYAGAAADCRGAFALGTALYDERLSFAELTAGLDLLARSANGWAAALQKQGDSAGAAALRQFDERRIDYVINHVLPLQNVIGAIDQNLIAQNAGDIAKLAQASPKEVPERMWRVEAILKLGRYRFDAGRAADQRAAPQILKQIAARDHDPVIAAAVRAAQALTLDSYRLID
jgi:hypothetical protein